MSKKINGKKSYEISQNIHIKYHKNERICTNNPMQKVLLVNQRKALGGGKGFDKNDIMEDIGVLFVHSKRCMPMGAYICISPYRNSSSNIIPRFLVNQTPSIREFFLIHVFPRVQRIKICSSCSLVCGAAITSELQFCFGIANKDANFVEFLFRKYPLKKHAP